MELNEKQRQGLQIAVDRYNSGKKCTIISGYAGTGKSTLVKFIISALHVEDKDVVYTSFTGKATQVLAKKVILIQELYISYCLLVTLNQMEHMLEFL